MVQQYRVGNGYDDDPRVEVGTIYVKKDDYDALLREVKNFLNVSGRHHTEIAYNRLKSFVYHAGTG